MKSRFPILVVSALALSGCYSAPQTVDESLRDREERPGSAPRRWQFNDVPRIRDQKDIKTVVISEFVVEFVTHKLLSPGGSSASAVGLPSLLGLARRQAEYPKALLKALPQQLFDEVVARFGRMGVKVVATQAVTSSKAYAGYETEPGVEGGSVLRLLDPTGGDTGRIRQVLRVPLPGLARIVGVAAKAKEIEDVDAAILTELEADVVFRARFRVGVHDGKASMESGSIITVTGKKILGSIVSERSLLSDGSVLSGDGFLPVRGHVYEVDAESYLEEMRTLFPAYLEVEEPQKG